MYLFLILLLLLLFYSVALSVRIQRLIYVKYLWQGSNISKINCLSFFYRKSPFNCCGVYWTEDRHFWAMSLSTQLAWLMRWRRPDPFWRHRRKQRRREKKHERFLLHTWNRSDHEHTNKHAREQVGSHTSRPFHNVNWYRVDKSHITRFRFLCIYLLNG